MAGIGEFQPVRTDTGNLANHRINCIIHADESNNKDKGRNKDKGQKS